MTEHEFKMIGDIKGSGTYSKKQVQNLMQELQTFMNDAGITKIDVCLDPFNKGPVKLTPSGIVMSTQN